LKLLISSPFEFSSHARCGIAIYRWQNKKWKKIIIVKEFWQLLGIGYLRLGYSYTANASNFNQEKTLGRCNDQIFFQKNSMTFGASVFITQGERRQQRRQQAGLDYYKI
jgi:uncharacterized radical SAM superfamily Fe-S cluster-containing enzyme